MLETEQVEMERLRRAYLDGNFSALIAAYELCIDHNLTVSQWPLWVYDGVRESLKRYLGASDV